MASEGAKARAKPSHPTFLQMAKEALTELAEKPGSSVPKIQTFIAEKYSLDPDSVKVHLKPALAKGLENETFVRPKNSEAKGYTGRFKLNKAKEAEEAKKQKEKEKAQKAKEKAKADTKKPAKPVTKRASSKSPKKAAAKTKKSPKKAAASKSKAKPTANKTKSRSDKSKPPKVNKQLKTPKKVAKTKAKTPKSK